MNLLPPSHSPLFAATPLINHFIVFIKQMANTFCFYFVDQIPPENIHRHTPATKINPGKVFNKKIMKVIGCVRYIFASFFSFLNGSTCQIRKNVFYFTSKALSVLEKTKFYNSAFLNFMASSNA